MNTLEAVLQESAEYLQLIEKLKSLPAGRSICVTGGSGSGQVMLMSALAAAYPYSVIVTYSEIRAREIYDDYLLCGREAVLYPAKDFIFSIHQQIK